ncbi:MAG: B12-binding domain-containing radical SAM protein [Spirochaetota bacterium]
MRIGILIPPITDFYTTSHRLSALGAAAGADTLRAMGHQVSVFNCLAPARLPVRTVPLPAQLSYLTPLLVSGEHGPISFFSQYKQFGTSVAYWEQPILSVRPEVMFISCFAFAYADDAIASAAYIHSLLPDVPIILCGAGVSVLPDYFLAHDAVHAVFCGEAEKEALRQLLASTQSGVSQPDFRQPERSPESLEMGIQQTAESKSLVTVCVSLSRGCPRTCSFCSNHLVHGHTFRTVSVEHAIEAFSGFLQTTPRNKHIHVCLEDDNILLAPEYLLEIMRAFRNLRPGTTFSAENGLDYRLLNTNLIDVLVAAGMVKFNLSLVSLSEQQLETADRAGNSSLLEETIRYIDSKGLPSVTYFICGLEQDTPQRVVNTIRWLSRLPTTTGISPYYAVPGLAAHQDSSSFFAEGALVCKGSSVYPWFQLSSRHIVTAFRLVRYDNALKNAHHLDDLLDCCRYEQKLYTISKGSRHEVPEYDREMVTCYFS